MSTPDRPRVRSVSEGLPGARRIFDALVMVAFGVLCFALSGTTGQPGLAVLVGVAALGYGGWIALSAGGYLMPYALYLIPVGGVLWLFWG